MLSVTDHPSNRIGTLRQQLELAAAGLTHQPQAVEMDERDLAAILATIRHHRTLILAALEWEETGGDV